VEETKLVERPKNFERPARGHYEGRICAVQEYFGAMRYEGWARFMDHRNDKSIQFITVEPLVQSIEAPRLAMRKAMLLVPDDLYDLDRVG